LTLAGFAGWIILLCRPLFHSSWTSWWHEAHTVAPTGVDA
jgi:hypothetical protein